MSKLLKQAQDVQQQIEKVQSQLSDMIIERVATSKKVEIGFETFSFRTTISHKRFQARWGEGFLFY